MIKSTYWQLISLNLKNPPYSRHFLAHTAFAAKTALGPISWWHFQKDTAFSLFLTHFQKDTAFSDEALTLSLCNPYVKALELEHPLEDLGIENDLHVCVGIIYD
jgi:hypothetical protein